MTDQATLPATTRAPKPPLAAGASLSAIIPTTIEETFRLAEAVHRSGLAPSTLKTVEAITIAVMTGMEVGLKPMQALASIAVINGRATIWGDGLIAIVRDSPLCLWIQEEIFGEGDEMFAVCTTHRRGEPQPVMRRFSVADAKRAGLWGKSGPWTQYPQRMLQMRSRAWCLRDVYPDVTRGMQVREEVEDYDLRDVTPHSRQPQRSGVAARLAGNTDGDGFKARAIEHQTPHDPVTGEIIETEAQVGRQGVDSPSSIQSGDEPSASERGPSTDGSGAASGTMEDRPPHTNQQTLEIDASEKGERETGASGIPAAAAAAEGAGSSPAGSLPELLEAYGAFLWRTAHVDKLDDKAKEFWKDRADSKPEKGTPAAALFGEIMAAHKQRQADGPEATKTVIAEIVERGRAA